MGMKKNSYATEEEVDNFFKSPPSLDDIDDSIIERSKEIIDVNFTFVKEGKTVTGRTPSEPEIQNIKPKEWEHHGTVIGRMRTNMPSFQCIAKDHPKLTFLDVINDGKRLDVWKDDFKMISEINVGKYCIDEIIKRHKRPMILVLNDVSIVRTRGDLK